MELPIILCGPIIRRVEPTKIFIWISTSKHFRVSAELFQVQKMEGDDNNKYERISERTQTKTIRLGKKLFVSVIEILPTESAFPTDTLLGYNLHFTRSTEKYDLSSFGMLNSSLPESITYGKLKYPTFYIAANNTTNILYSSCRKLHGVGKDALLSGDQMLQEHHINLSSRPSALFMVGDQIYADDVADPISPVIRELGYELMGRTEELDVLEAQLDSEPFRTSLKLIHGRQFIMENFCKFTSRKPHNHLIEFGEFAAMYLLSWSPQLWNSFNIGSLKKEDVYFMYPNDNHHREEREKEWQEHQKRYENQRKSLIQFQQSLPNIRRLMANIPTYMIFDDHDITDDWNITSDWKANVWNAPLGRHVIANGLGAYWAFQGWGNDPDCFTSLFLKTIYKYLKTLKIGSVAYDDWVNILWEFDSWPFVAPTFPKTLFLDTRTQRAFDAVPKPEKIGKVIKEQRRGPQLISEIGWKKASQRLQDSEWRSKERLMIVSPVPLYGIGLIESFLHRYIFPFKLLRLPVQTSFDLEAWRFNEKGFHHFLKQLIEWELDECIILSGDAHIASTVMTKVTFPDKKQLDLYQFTTSPLKNESFTGLKGFLLKTLVWLYGQQTHNHQFNRYCDGNLNLLLEDETDPTHKSSYIWNENIRYLQLENGSIIDTKNNLGHIKISPNSINNRLLKDRSSISFESINKNKKKS